MLPGVRIPGTGTTIAAIASTTPVFSVSISVRFWFLVEMCVLNYVILYSDIEAECQDDYMKIRIGFNGSFNGLLYSSGK